MATAPELQNQETLLTLLLRIRASATHYSAGAWEGQHPLKAAICDNKGMEPHLIGEKPLWNRNNICT